MTTGGLETAPETVTPEVVPLEAEAELDAESADDDVVVPASEDVSAEEATEAAVSDADESLSLQAAVETSIAAAKIKSTNFFIKFLHL